MAGKAPTPPMEVIEIATSALTYLPTPDQRRAKSAFWAVYETDPSEVSPKVDLATALRLSGDSRISKWWKGDGFRQWFQNKEEFRQRLENMSHLALDRLEILLADERTPAPSAVAAAKLVLEASKKMPSKSADVPILLDKKVQDMTKQELEKFLQDRLSRLPQAVEPVVESDEK